MKGGKLSVWRLLIRDTEDLADNNWGTKSYSSDDNDGIEMPDTRVHSWDSSDSVALKQQLKHMFSKGIDRVSKQIAAKVLSNTF
jgi:hypothetical protein